MASKTFPKLTAIFLIFVGVTLLGMARAAASEMNHTAVEQLPNKNASSISEISDDSSQGSFWWMPWCPWW